MQGLTSVVWWFFYGYDYDMIQTKCSLGQVTVLIAKPCKFQGFEINELMLA